MWRRFPVAMRPDGCPNPVGPEPNGQGRTQWSVASSKEHHEVLPNAQHDMPKSFQIESDQDSIVLRFNRDLVDPSALARLLDYIETSSVRESSHLMPEQAHALADDIDAAVWETVKHKYTEAS